MSCAATGTIASAATRAYFRYRMRTPLSGPKASAGSKATGIIRYARMRNLLFAALGVALSSAAIADDGGKLLTIDHYVRVKSTVPAIAGQEVPIYVRERVLAGAALRGATGGDRVA